jgi:hypothetical protein
MTDSERIDRLEAAVQRLCDIIAQVNVKASGMGFASGFGLRPYELELIKQSVRGDPEPR